MAPRPPTDECGTQGEVSDPLTQPGSEVDVAEQPSANVSKSADSTIAGLSYCSRGSLGSSSRFVFSISSPLSLVLHKESTRSGRSAGVSYRDIGEAVAIHIADALRHGTSGK